MQTRCATGWGLYLLLCDKYSDEGRGDPGSEYHQTLEAYRQHHQDCDQCHGRTVELTELAEAHG